MAFPSALESRFHDVELIGQGPRFVVYGAKLKNSAIRVAVKVMRPEVLACLEGRSAISSALQSELLKSSSAAYVRLYLYDYGSDGAPYFLYERMDENLTGKGEPREPGLVKQLMRELCQELAGIHSSGGTHGALHPNNLFLKDGHLFIGDYGFEGAFPVPATAAMPYGYSVIRYKALERKRTPSGDIWAAGCVFAELATGSPLFTSGPISSQKERIYRILGRRAGTGDITDSDIESCKMRLAAAVPQLSQEGIDLLYEMLQEHPVDRIGAEAALEHPFFG